MKKRVFVFILFLALAVLSIYVVSAESIDEQIKQVTYYAEQYETGNINYAQLVVYMSLMREKLSAAMGAVEQEYGAVLKAEQLESALGKPTETTKWVWIEGEEREKKMEQEIPAWRKIIFDGRKTTIWLGAWPNIRIKNGEEFLFYRLHFDIEFKKAEESIDIKQKIEEVRALAEAYKENPSKENMEALAEKSVSAEQIFNSNSNRKTEKCEEFMNGLFGSENKKDSQKTFVEEIKFFEGDNFEAILRLEMCDDCNWRWINMNLHFETRGRFKHPDENGNYVGDKERYSGFELQQFESESRNKLEEVKNKIANGEYQGAVDTMGELRVLTDAWNEKSNDVYKELEDKYRVDFDSMTQEERDECSRTYCWIKKDQERRIAENELRDSNYERRKQFYLELFSSYEKKEFYYEEEQWEKRLVEKFREFGEEICTNNIDDNSNQQIDCSDSQCGGKLCGYETITITDGNETREEQRELYCISGTCQAREEKIIDETRAICGNHICEENEELTCLSDCAICVEHKPIECNGRIIFSGQDKNGCSLEPVCLSDEIICESDADCADPLCGDASCVEGKCKVIELTECREPECAEGSKKTVKCGSGEEIIVENCFEGTWKKTGLECETAEQEAEKIEEVVGEECIVKSDCGNENDVCSNGKCIALPVFANVLEESGEEIIEHIEGEVNEAENTINRTGLPAITGNIIFSFFRNLAKITGFAVEEGNNETEEIEETTDSNLTEEGSNEVEGGEERGEQGEFEDEEERQRRESEERERSESEDKQRRENECNERCTRECYDREIRPCTEDCIIEGCDEELECNVDEVRVSCEESCKAQKDDSCETSCFDKCIEGKETWIEPERKEHKQEEFVFTVGGTCRNAQGKTESFIWFGGWGDDFNDFHLIKNKYYSRGGGEWCEENLENLLLQRKELEESLNEDFAYWFFEKYVANSADEWENHRSGIFDLYWRDVDISRQMIERLQCLNRNGLPEHKLINFKYETEYGSFEFWEEIKTAKVFEDSEETEIISPYMKTWLFPSREFFQEGTANGNRTAQVARAIWRRK